MNFSLIIKTVLTKLIFALILTVIFGFVGYFIFPNNLTNVSFVLILVGIYGSHMNSRTIREIKESGDSGFIDDLTPFLLSLVLTSITSLLFIVIALNVLPIIFGSSFIMPVEYYGISSKIWMGILVIFYIIWNSFTDAKFYDRY